MVDFRGRAWSVTVAPRSESLVMMESDDPAARPMDSPQHDSEEEVVRLRSRVARLETALRRSEDKSMWIHEIGSAIGTHVNRDELMSFIADRITRLMNAERATLFVIDSDDEGEFLCSRYVAGNRTREIRVRMGEGIAGWVALTGKSINVKDAYRDERFNPRFDVDSGFTTSSVLCQPMRDKEGRTIGVAQVLNRVDGYFGIEDETLLSAITNTAATILENNQLYLRAIDRAMALDEAKRMLEDRVRRLDTLYDLQRRINAVDRLVDVVETIATSTAETIASNGCSVTLVGAEGLQSFAYMRGPKNGSFAPVLRTWDSAVRDEVLRTGKPVVCNTMSCMPPIVENGRSALPREREAASPGATTHVVRSVCAVPLVDNDVVIGCVELINRRSLDENGRRRGFSDDDRKMLALVGGQISAVVARSIARDREETTDRLTMIGRMLSGVVHDLKTPLTIASGYVQLMSRASDAETRSQYARRIQGQFDHLDRMTREVLAYARGETQTYMRTVHIHALETEIQELLSHEFADHKIELSVRADFRGDVRMDDGKIKRVLFNLARNAREAMPSGGTYTVVFSRDDEDLVIRCTDSGAGIPEAIRERIFEAFVSSRKGANSGLGLAIVRKLVEDHGGSISFESLVDTGTTFEIRLPVDGPTVREEAAVVHAG